MLEDCIVEVVLGSEVTWWVKWDGTACSSREGVETCDWLVAIGASVGLFEVNVFGLQNLLVPPSSDLILDVLPQTIVELLNVVLGLAHAICMYS